MTDIPTLIERMDDAIKRCRKKGNLSNYTVLQDAKAALEALQWKPINKDTPTDELHIRGVWVHRAKTGERLYFQSDIGSIDDDGDFVSRDGEDFGWAADDYTHWVPLPPLPEKQTEDN